MIFFFVSILLGKTQPNTKKKSKKEGEGDNGFSYFLSVLILRPDLCFICLCAVRLAFKAFVIMLIRLSTILAIINYDSFIRSLILRSRFVLCQD